MSEDEGDQDERPVGEDLFLVMRVDGGPEGGECFERAVVLATSWEEAQEDVSRYIALCNDAAKAEAAASGSTEEGAPDGQIAFDPEFVDVLLLASGVQRPADVDVDGDGILVFETRWLEEEE